MSRCAPSVPAAAALARELLAHVVPDLLGVDQQAVDVEDDGLDHRPSSAGRGRRASWSRGRARASSTSPTKNVWSPAAHLVDASARVSQPTAPSSSRGSSSRTGIPSQSTSGGTLRAKCCARRSWSPREDRRRPLPRLAEHLVERGDARERDRRRAAARARARRATTIVEPGPAAVRLGDDDRDAGRPAPEQLALLQPGRALELLHARGYRSAMRVRRREPVGSWRAVARSARARSAGARCRRSLVRLAELVVQCAIVG